MNLKSTAGKGAYASPKLTTFGSVRNLTGGSMQNGDDGMGTMTQLLNMGGN